jgi:alpha-1,3-mannosyltransferase
MLNILHVVRQFYPMIGGLENYVLNLAKEQISDGNRVSVVTLNRNFTNNKALIEKETVFGIEIIRIPYFGSSRYPFAFSVLKHIKGYDIVHVHAIDFFADFLAFTKTIHRQKLILTTHGGFFHTQKNRLLKKFFFNTITRFSLKRYNRIIACSSNDYEQFSKISCNVTLINNGVDVRKYSNVPKIIEKDTLITVGRIDSHKRIDKLIKIISILKEKGTNVQLKIVGPDSRNLLNKLQQLTKDLRVEKNVIFKGKISEDELTESYSKAKIFISASEYEGFGIAAVEALASGTLCVLSNIPSFIEILGDNEFGRIVNFDNENEVVQNIEFLLNMDKSVYNDLSKQARLNAEN